MADKTELNYEEDIRISEHDLDKEWLRQSPTFFKYARELADARDRLARAEQRRDVEEAEANDRARKRLTVPDQKPPTVDAIKSAVIKDEIVKSRVEEVFALKHQVDILAAAVTAFEHRKRALENLVTLHGQQYFAGPSVPNDIGREFVRQTREAGRETAREKTAERTGRRRD